MEKTNRAWPFNFHFFFGPVVFELFTFLVFFFGCRAAFVVVLFCPRHFRAACPVPVQKLLVVGRYPLAAVLQLARFLFGLIFSQPSPCCFLAASLPGRSIFFFFDVWSRAEKFQFDSAPTIVLFYFLQISAISCIRFAPFTSGAPNKNWLRSLPPPSKVEHLSCRFLLLNELINLMRRYERSL